MIDSLSIFIFPRTDILFNLSSQVKPYLCTDRKEEKVPVIIIFLLIVFSLLTK